MRSKIVWGVQLVLAINVVVACSSDDGGSNKAADTDAAVPATCNNGALDPGEDCDGTLFGTHTCATETMGVMAGGSLRCNGCHIDHSGCVSGAPGAGGGGVVAGNGGSVSQPPPPPPPMGTGGMTGIPPSGAGGSTSSAGGSASSQAGAAQGGTGP